jgi:hypothetical protein
MSVALSLAELERVREISAAIPGWSDGRQYAFFRNVLRADPAVSSLFMAGVYQGRDLAFLLDIVAREHPGRDLELFAVDKFSAEPCADWPAHLRGKTWEQAGFGPAPSHAKALENLAPFLARAPAVSLDLRPGDAVATMASLGRKFDAIYLDTSHDYQTVKRELEAVPAICRFPCILAGDDYSDSGTWGVARAVREKFGPAHRVFASWIWYKRLLALESFHELIATK